MSILPNAEDWACFIDGDAMFLTPDFGNQIQEIINRNPNTGLFTCYTNRVGNLEQCYRGKISEVRDIAVHKQIANKLQRKHRHTVKRLKRIISGHVMIIQKKTWLKHKFKDGLLSVDNNISKKIMRGGQSVLLMEGVYVLHYYRLMEGRRFKKHLLKPKKI